MTTDGARGKPELRAELRRARRGLGEAELRDAGIGIARRLDALVAETGARTVSCYLELPGEPPTRPFLAGALSRGIRILLPVARADGTLDWADGSSSETETTGLFGIAEPGGARRGPEVLQEADLLLIPAAAVDRQGTRLGWGRGYYDRALAALTRRVPVFALVHDHEMVDSLPREAHDRPVDGAVTPLRTLRFGSA